MPPTALAPLLSTIRQREAPPVILVGGNNEYLAEQAFRDIRDAFTESYSGAEIDAFPAGTDLATVVDAWRTHSLFASARLLILPELQAFVTRKEIDSHLGRAIDDWRTAKTDRKRSSAVVKLMHVLGLTGLDVADPEGSILQSLEASSKDAPVISQMLESARAAGKRSTRGEGDAALLAEAVAGGGAPGAVLLLRAGEIPRDSATVQMISERGAVVITDLTREKFTAALDAALAELSERTGASFDASASAALRRRLGIERVLADKFSKDVPDLRAAINEAERVAMLAGSSGRVTAAMIDEEISEVGGGARFEFTSLWTEGKLLEAVEKLRDLVAQARREDPRTPVEIQYGRFLFPLADEIRQSIAILSFCRARRIDPARAGSYNQFRDTLAEPLGQFLKDRGLVRQRPHPFPLFRKLQSVRGTNEVRLFRALAVLAELDFQRKSGGAPVDVSLETFVLAGGRM